MVKKVLIGIPPALLAQIDFVAAAEHRTRSDLIREALRRYVTSFKLPEIASCVQQSDDEQVSSANSGQVQAPEPCLSLASRIAG